MDRKVNGSVKVSDDPTILPYWDVARNLPANHVSYRSNTPAYWICPNCDHHFQRLVSNMGVNPSCPKCVKSSLTTRVSDNPRLMAIWSEKNTINPRDASLKHKASLLWTCERAHDWLAYPSAVLKGKTCPTCAKEDVISSKAPHLFTEYAGEDPITEVLVKKPVLWNCSACDFSWRSSLSNRLKGTNCPQCHRGTHAELQRQRSLGKNGPLVDNAKLVSEWSPRNKVAIEDLPVTYAKKVEWRCAENHYWWTTPGIRFARDHDCPFCTAKESTNKYREEKAKAGESFGHLRAHLLDEWSNKNTVDPFLVLTGSHRRVIWNCRDCQHEWETPVNRRASGSQCPKCSHSSGVSKPEAELVEFIRTLGYTVECNDRKILGGKEIDAYIPELQIGFEFNGIYWHSDQVMLKSKGENAETAHKEKMRLASEKQVALFYVWEDDWKSGIAKDWVKAALEGLYPSDLLVLSKG